MKYMISYHRERSNAVAMSVVEGENEEAARTAFHAQDADMVHPLGPPTILKVEAVPE